jgi:hypothetical protein
MVNAWLTGAAEAAAAGIQPALRSTGGGDASSDAVRSSPRLAGG